MGSLLIVDDEPDIRELLELCLTHEGYSVIQCKDGQEALSVMESKAEQIDLILLDVMMPKMDGLTTCSRIRKFSMVPIIFLTAKTQDTDQILGLQIGGDDYIKKPFTPAVLTAKVRAILRRVAIMTEKEATTEGLLIVSELVIDERAFKVSKGTKELSLTKTEFEILLLLVKHQGQVFSIQRIYEMIWKEPYFEDSSNTVMVHIKRLRNKIDEKDSPKPIIQTVWGVGYKIE